MPWYCGCVWLSILLVFAFHHQICAIAFALDYTTIEPENDVTTEPESEVTPEPENEVTSEPESEVTSEPESEVTSEPESEVTSEPESEVTSEPESEVTSEPESEVASEPESEVTSEPESEVTSEPESKVTSEPESEVTSEPESEVTSEPESEVTSEPESEVTSEPESEVASEPDGEVTSEPESEVTSEPESEVTSEPEREVTSEPEREVTSEPESEVASEPEREVISEPESELTYESEHESEDAINSTYPESDPESEPEVEPENSQNCSNSTDPCSEKEPEPIGELFTDAELFAWVTTYAIWIVLIVSLNIVIIISVVKEKTLIRKTPNMFLLSLIIARTSVAVLVMPARIMGLYSSEMLGSTLCKLCHFCGSGSAAASVFSTCGVAVTKLIEVQYPSKQMKVQGSLVSIIFVWLTGFIYGIRSYFLNDLTVIETFAGPIWACTADPKQIVANQIFIFIDFSVLFVIPLFIVVICYSRVVRVLNKKLRSPSIKLDDLKSIEEKTKTKIDTQDQRLEDKKTLKGIKMLIAVMIIFTLCYLSIYAWKLYIFFNSINVFIEQFVHVEQGIYLISYANPWMNVFVYLYFRDDIRNSVFSKCRMRKNVTKTPVIAISR